MSAFQVEGQPEHSAKLSSESSLQNRIVRLGLFHTFQTWREWPGLTVLEDVLLAHRDPARELLVFEAQSNGKQGYISVFMRGNTNRQ